MNPLAVRRQAVEAGLSALLAHFLIAAEGTTPSKEKERRAVEDRKRSIIEPFLKTIGVDNNGPSGGGFIVSISLSLLCFPFLKAGCDGLLLLISE